MTTTHHLSAGPQTVHWGYFDASEPPRLEVNSGDEVVIETLSGGPDVMPETGFAVPAALREVHAKVPRPLPGHILTGPVAVRGAQPGDVLEVGIEEISLGQDWGWNAIRPLTGALPNDFQQTRIVHIPLDRETHSARLAWGAQVPLRPFFGVMGVAPPPAWGMVTSLIPRRHGGNIDNKELIAGTRLFLPVHVDGALFSVGDGHAAQGDGEVCVTAIETGLVGRFKLTLHKGWSLTSPRAETSTHMITMAFDPDLDVAARTALRDMISVLGERKGLSREDAYMLCSLAADLRITQMVNQHNGVHVMLERHYLS